MPTISPISAGLKGRCVTCGQGRVYRSYLKFKPKCEACGQDFSKSDTADGPAFFVGFIVLMLFAPIGFIIPMASQPLWLKLLMFAILVSITIWACLAMLPIAKAIMLALQIKNNAEQAELNVDQ